MWLKSKGHLSQVLERILLPYGASDIFSSTSDISSSTNDISSSASDIFRSYTHVVIQLALKG